MSKYDNNILWTDEEMIKYKLDPRKVKSLVNRLRKIAEEMVEMDLYVCGIMGTGSLMHRDRPMHIISGNFGVLEADYQSEIACLGNGFYSGDW